MVSTWSDAVDLLFKNALSMFTPLKAKFARELCLGSVVVSGAWPSGTEIPQTESPGSGAAEAEASLMPGSRPTDQELKCRLWLESLAWVRIRPTGTEKEEAPKYLAWRRERTEKAEHAGTYGSADSSRSEDLTPPQNDGSTRRSER